MTDPLSALEGQRFTPQLPASRSSAPNPVREGLLDAVRMAQQVVDLEAKLAKAEAERDALKERLDAEAKGGGMFGSKHKARADALSEENVELRRKLAELEARLAAEDRMEEVFLPTIAEAETALATVRHENAELAMALSTTQAQVGQMRETLEELEFQRDERDELLRREEAARQQAERTNERTRQQLAQVRMKALASQDPKEWERKRKDETPVSISKKRVRAVLGDIGSLVELGNDYLDGVCPMCDASPACQRDRLLEWPHGKLIPRHIQDYLQLIVQEAQARGGDPFKALEAWCSGVPMAEYFEGSDAFDSSTAASL